MESIISPQVFVGVKSIFTVKFCVGVFDDPFACFSPIALRATQLPAPLVAADRDHCNPAAALRAQVALADYVLPPAGRACYLLVS